MKNLIIPAVMAGISLFGSSLASGITTQAQKLVILKDIIPESEEGHLTPKLLLRITMGNATSVKQIKSQLIDIDKASLQVEAQFDTVLTSNITQVSERSQKQPFGNAFNELNQTTFDIGFTRQFRTGTSLSSTLTFADSAIKPENPFYREKESSLEINLKQSLWKNSLGNNFSKQILLANQSRKTQENQVKNELESLALSTLSLFYDVWAKKETVIIADGNKNTQKRLLDMIAKQFSLGVSEKPDLMDAEIQYELAKNNSISTRLDFFDSWRKLVISLKLSDELLDINPTIIPFRPEDTSKTSKEICQASPDTVDSYPSLEFEGIKKKLNTVKTQLEISHNNMKPDLFLFTGAKTNSLTDEWGESTEETVAGKSPQVNVGIGIEVNLGQSTAKGEALSHFKTQKQIELSLSSFKEDRRIKWTNLCGALKVHESSKLLLKQSLQKYIERAKLQDRRFRLGRITALELYQAHAIVHSTKSNLIDVEKALYQLGWQLRALRGDLPEYVEESLKSAS